MRMYGNSSPDYTVKIQPVNQDLPRTLRNRVFEQSIYSICEPGKLRLFVGIKGVSCLGVISFAP
jgi:hypothetical protein